LSALSAIAEWNEFRLCDGSHARSERGAHQVPLPTHEADGRFENMWEITMGNDIRILSAAELDTVAGGTSVEEAMALMAKWNAAITAAGQAGIESANRDLFTPIRPGGTGGSCPNQYHH
jgi:hypothetical protein